MNFFSFFATCIRRNLLEYNNSDINEKKKMGKWKADVVWNMVPIVCCRSLWSDGIGGEFLQPDTSFRIFGWYIYILYCWTNINPERK